MSLITNTSNPLLDESNDRPRLTLNEYREQATRKISETPLFPQEDDSYYIQKQRNQTYNYILALTIASGGFHLGYYISIFNPMGTDFLKHVYKIFNKTEQDEALGDINVLFCLGCMIGCFVASILAKRFGRMKSMFFTEIFRILVIGQYFIENYYLLFVTRLLCGITAGIFTTQCPLASTEILPTALQSFGGVMFYSSNTFAILIGTSLGYFLTGKAMAENWQFVLTWPILITFMRMAQIGCLFRLESPNFYLEKYAQKLDNEQSIVTVSELTNNGIEQKYYIKPNFHLDDKYWDKINKSLKKVYKPESADKVLTKQQEDHGKVVRRKELSFGTLCSSYYRKRYFFHKLQKQVGNRDLLEHFPAIYWNKFLYNLFCKSI